MSIEIIQEKVSEYVDKIPDVVFQRVFEKARHVHIQFANHHNRSNECDCDYCRTLRLYVSTKLSLHRTKRKYLGDYYGVDEISEVEEKLNALKEMAKYQRQQKNLAAKS